MTFEQEMARFFKLYSPEARAAVQANPDYQKAALEQNPVKAQEIAAALLEGNAKTREEFRMFQGPLGEFLKLG